jgi:hypothetical protein
MREPSDPGSSAPAPATPGDGPAKRANLSPEVSNDLRDRKEATVVAEVGSVRAIEDKTFVWTAERRWVDSAWDGKAELSRIEAWSDDYFALLATSDRVARYLSVGERAIVVLDGTAYEIVPPA